MPELKHILFMAPSQTMGGAENHLLQFARFFQTKSITCSAFVSNNEATREYNEALQRYGVSLYPSPSKESARLGEPIQLSLGVLRYWLKLRQIKPDAIYVNLPWPGLHLDFLFAAHLHRIRTVVMHRLVPPNWVLSSANQKCYHRLLKGATTLAAVSQSNADIISHTLNIPCDQVAVFTNAISRPPADDRLPDNLRINANELNILTVGRLVNQKGYDLITPTIPHLLEEFPNLRFWWIGDGPDRKKLEAQLQSYGCQDRVQIVSGINQAARYMQHFDLLLFPSRFEGLPRTVMEAMWQRLPILASQSNGVIDILNGKTDAVIFRNEDTCDLLEQLRFALRHPDKMQDKAQVAYKGIQQHNETTMHEAILKELHFN